MNYTLYYVVSTLIFILGFGGVYLSLSRKTKGIKKRSRREKNNSTLVAADIPRKYFHIESIDKNLVKTDDGICAVTLRYSTKDTDTMTEIEKVALEENIFSMSKKFRSEVKLRIKEDRQDLGTLAGDLEKRLELDDVSDKLKRYIEKYALLLKTKSGSLMESQVSKYITLYNKDEESLKYDVDEMTSKFERASIDYTVLSRHETIIDLMESINHGSREKLNIHLDPIDQIAPECLKELDDYLYLGKNKYCRVYGAIAFDTVSYLGNYDVLFKSLGKDVEICFSLDRINQMNGIRILKRERSKAGSNYLINKDSRYQEKYQYCDELIGEMQKGKNTLHKCRLFIKVWGESYEALEKHSKRLEKDIEETGTSIRVYALQQTQAFASSLPLHGNYTINEAAYNNYIDKYRFLSLMATGNNGLQHKGGIYWGYEVQTKSPVVYNPFVGPPQLSNPMIAVFGTSGSGKSETMMGLVQRNAAAGDWCIYFDLENEAEERIKSIGGLYVDLRPGEKTGLNPLQVDIEEDKRGRRFVDLHGKRSEIKSFLNILMSNFSGREFTGVEVTTIEEAIFDLYKHEYGMTEEPSSLYEEGPTDSSGAINLGPKMKVMPQLSDLRKELEKHIYTKEIADLMKIVTGNGSLAMFDCQTTLDISHQRVIGFGYKELNDEFMRQFCVINLLSYTWAMFSNYQLKHVKKWVFIDEAKFALVKPEIAEHIDNLELRGRKYVISMVIGSQYLGDMLPKEGDSEQTSVVLSTSATVIILKQYAREALKVTKYFALPESYAKEIMSFSAGEGLILSETRRTRFQFELIK